MRALDGGDGAFQLYCRALKAAGVQASDQTIRSWGSREIIAPLHYRTVLPIIFKLQNRGNSDADVEKCVLAIQQIYEARNKASQHLDELISTQQVSINQRSIEVGAGGSKIRLDLHDVDQVSFGRSQFRNNLYRVLSAKIVQAS